MFLHLVFTPRVWGACTSAVCAVDLIHVPCANATPPRGHARTQACGPWFPVCSCKDAVSSCVGVPASGLILGVEGRSWVWLRPQLLWMIPPQEAGLGTHREPEGPAAQLPRTGLGTWSPAVWGMCSLGGFRCESEHQPRVRWMLEFFPLWRCFSSGFPTGLLHAASLLTCRSPLCLWLLTFVGLMFCKCLPLFCGLLFHSSNGTCCFTEASSFNSLV